MPLGLPKLPGIKLPSSPLEPLRDIIRGGRERVEKAGSDIRSLADELQCAPRYRPREASASRLISLIF